MPAILERCVLRVIGNPKFKPGVDPEKRRSSAYAICTAALQKSGEMSTTEENYMAIADKMVSMSDQSFFVSSCLSDIQTMESPVAGQEFVRREIDVLREGTFDNPQFGELVFDEPKMDAFISNFKAGVVGRDVVLKVEHGGSSEAAGWFRDLYKAKRDFNGRELLVLRAVIDFTPLGVEKVRSGQYKYFSAEYKDHYCNKETGADYGPTIPAGALTNEPFIPGLMPIILSDDGSKNSVKIFNEVKTEAEEGGIMKELLEKLQKELADLKGQFTAMAEADQKAEVGKALSEKIGSFEKTVTELSEQIAAAEKASAGADGKAKEVETKLAKTETELSEANALIRALKGDVDTLKIESDKNKSVAMSERVKNYKTQLKEQGIWPATIEAVEKILLADGLKGLPVVTLSEPDKDGKPVSKSLDVLATIEMILGSIPKESRVVLSETTVGGTQGGKTEEITPEMRKAAMDRAFKSKK